MEGALDPEGAGRVLVEHDDPLVCGRPRRRERERAGEVAEVERVLDGVEAEALARERAVGEAAYEGVPQDRRPDRRDRLPELAREGCAHRAQRPRKTGSRFSTKAFAASRWSSVMPQRVWCHASRSSESLSVPVSAALKLRFM